MSYTKAMFRQITLFLVAGVILLSPLSAFAATVNFFGPIIPDGTNGQPDCHCDQVTGTDGNLYPSAPDWSCVLATVQNAVALGITFIIVLITLVIAYSGVMIMSAPNNARHREAGRAMVTNAIIGLVIVLTAWLIVDFVMKAFYNESKGQEVLSSPDPLPWNSIFSDDFNPEQVCFIPKVTQSTTPSGGVSAGTGSAPSGSAVPTGTPPAVSGNGSASKRPSTPSGFSLSASGTTVNLMWNDVSDSSVDWYVIERGLSGASYKEIKRLSTDENSYSDTGLTTGTRYYYRLFTWNEAGYSVGAQKDVTTEGTAPGTGGTSGCADPVVTVNSGVVISSSAVSTLKSIMKSGCFPSATITSGRRSSADQARVMYDNIVSFGTAKQYELYSSYGDQVIAVYEEKKAEGKSATDIKAAMQAKIVALGPSNVSRHCSDTYDTFDVAPSSIADKTKFESYLNAAVTAGKIHRFLTPGDADPSYHIEIKL